VSPGPHADGEFYVGYLDPAPPGLARWLRRLTAGLLVAGPLLAGLVGALQGRQPSGRYEFATSRTYEGVVFERPIPFLRLDGLNIPLVGAGKHGAAESIRGLHGRRVSFEGRLVHRERATLIEIAEPRALRTLEPRPEEARLDPAEVLGEVDLTGELVDTKCYLGAMRPATGKVHRACAIRCLSGGVPPGLLVEHLPGEGTVLFLAGADGATLDVDPQLAGRRVRARGRLELHDGMPLLRAIAVEPVEPLEAIRPAGLHPGDGIGE